MMKRLFLTILAPIILISAVGGCIPEQDTAMGTREIAKQWVREKSGAIASQIAESVVNKMPALESIPISRIRDLFKTKTGWEFSDPQTIGDNKYSVTGIGQTDFEVPLLGAYTVSFNYNLEIDTEKKEVIHHLLDIGSMIIKRRSE